MESFSFRKRAQKIFEAKSEDEKFNRLNELLYSEKDRFHKNHFSQIRIRLFEIPYFMTKL
jgi:hypothetical protein